jgi:hypothetical protein
MIPETFYQTVAQLSFTLLGLWWLVLQTKYAEWIGNPSRRRMVTSISLYFLLPGGMSLFALLAAGNQVIWQAAFAVAGCLGLIAVLVFVQDAARGGSGGRQVLWQLIRLVTLVLYGGIVGVALAPDVVSQQLGVAPLIVAGIGESLLIVLGLALAWAYFVEPTKPPQPGSPYR